MAILFKYILVIFIFLQSHSHSSIKNKIIANVEDQIISSYDLKSKIRTTLVLSDQAISQESVNKTKNQALVSLINYKIKKNEILKFKIQTNNQAVNDHLQKISSKFKTDKKGLEEFFKINNLNFKLYLDEIETEYAWQRLIFQLYSNKININESEVEDELSKIINNKTNLTEYSLSEIEVLLPDGQNNKGRINEISEQIIKIGFENTATKFSTSTSALNEGKLGWISSKSLSKKILNIIKELKKGEISKPIIQSNTVTFLKLLDTKTSEFKSSDLERIKKQIIEKKNNELLNLFSNNHLSKIKNSSFIQIK